MVIVEAVVLRLTWGPVDWNAVLVVVGDGCTKRNGMETVPAVVRANRATRIGMSSFLRRWRTRGRFTVSYRSMDNER